MYSSYWSRDEEDVPWANVGEHHSGEDLTKGDANIKQNRIRKWKENGDIVLMILSLQI